MTETTGTETTASAAPGAVGRRQLLCGALALGAVGVGVLAGCGSSDTPSTGSSSPAGGGASPSAGGALAKLSDIPVGGGTFVTTSTGASVLLVQPEAGTVKAYNPACPHKGVPVREPQNGVMICPKHGSEFKTGDGSVTRGPATGPLAEIAVKVTGGDVTLA
jgi:nitrite reductase/ring-hydroxylating ferredoxin subunit